MEYLGFWVTCECVRPISEKGKDVVNMCTLKGKWGICQFIGLINYYKFMWSRWSLMIRPLTKSMPVNVKFRWTSVEHEDFEETE